MSREQSTVQQQSASSNPEPAREILAEQLTQVDRRKHEAVPANRDGDLTTSNIHVQAHKSERKLSEVNPDQGINFVRNYIGSPYTKCKYGGPLGHRPGQVE